MAESLDLLRFSAPKRLPVFEAERVFPLVRERDVFLFVQKEGKLFHVKGGALAPMDVAASPVFYRGKLLLFGTRNGSFTYRTIDFTE